MSNRSSLRAVGVFGKWCCVASLSAGCGGGDATSSGSGATGGFVQGGAGSAALGGAGASASGSAGLPSSAGSGNNVGDGDDACALSEPTGGDQEPHTRCYSTFGRDRRSGKSRTLDRTSGRTE